MSKFTVFEKEVHFSDAQDRFIELVQMIPALKKDAKTYFQKIYEDRWADITDVLDEYDTVVTTLISHLLKDKLYGYLIAGDIYDISEETMVEKCWDVSSADEAYNIIAKAYNQILEDYEDEVEYRQLRKAGRGRVVGGGFGFSGAVKGMAMAGAMNAVTGLGHSIVNAFGNLKSSIDADHAKEELFESKKTYRLLEEGAISSVVATVQSFIRFMNDYKESEGADAWFDGSPFSVKKAKTLLVNAVRFKEKRAELLFKAFVFCPYHPDVCEAIFVAYASERKNIVEICKALNIDITEIFEKVIKTMYPNKDDETSDDDYDDEDYDDEEDDDDADDHEDEDDADDHEDEAELSEEELIDIRKQIVAFMSEFGIEESETLDRLEENLIYKIADKYDDLAFDRKEEVISKIINCEVSDEIKKSCIYDNEIWELFEQYGVTIPEDEKLLLLFKKYEEIRSLKVITEERTIRLLDDVINAINFKDESGSIPFETKEAIFECLTGILEEQLKSKIDILELKDDLSSDIAEKAAEIIRDANIDFLTTSLKYRRPHEDMDVSDLRYCTLSNEEIPFIIYDERPLMYPGTYGFCLTDKRLVGKPEYDSKYEIPTDQIISFEKKGFLSNKFIVLTKSGSREIRAENLSSLGSFVDCLNQILTVLPNNEKAIKDREDFLKRKIAEMSVACVEKHPWLISYLGMEEKVKKIYENAGKYTEAPKPSNREAQTTTEELKRNESTGTVAQQESQGHVNSNTTEEMQRKIVPAESRTKEDTLLEEVSVIATNFFQSVQKFYRPEIYIHKGNNLFEHKKDDIWTRYYVDEEFPIFYIFQLNGGSFVPCLSITNLNMYTVKSPSAIPLESIVGIKAGMMSDALSVFTTSGKQEIYTELPSEGKELLASAILKIIALALKDKKEDFTPDIKNQNLSNINSQSTIEPPKSEEKQCEKVKTTLQNILELMKSDIIAQNEGARYLLPTSNSFAKKLEKAQKSYVNMSPNEIALILEDSSLFGNAKEGFVITNQYVYINNSRHSKVKFDVNDVVKVTAHANDATFYYVMLHTRENQYYLVMLMGKEYTLRNVDLIARLLSYICSAEIVESNRMHSDMAIWTCDCGSQNKGNFCSKCGKPRNK